jgi:hypothetical protein
MRARGASTAACATAALAWGGAETAHAYVCGATQAKHAAELAKRAGQAADRRAATAAAAAAKACAARAAQQEQARLQQQVLVSSSPGPAGAAACAVSA